MNKVVLITGASGGIGRECARYFASNNYDIVINYNTNYNLALDVYNDIIDNYHVTALLVHADISKEDEVIAMIDLIKEKFNKLDVVVNNAGIALDSDFITKSASSFNKVINTNLIGTFLVCKYAKALMNKGSIVNVSSNNSIDCYYPYSMEYDASKAGVNLLTKDLAVLFSPNIRVNAVAPGWVNTDMNKTLSEEFRKEEESRIILGRFAEPIEIAKVIYFLASDDASYLNGVILPVDGGRK